MRLFYDTFSSRLRGEILLFLSDAVAIAAAFLFATGAFQRDAAPLDTAFIALWAVLPRGVSKAVGWLRRRVDFASTFAASLGLVLVVATLLLAGWELVYVSAPQGMRVSPETCMAILVAWGTGFLLFLPGSYRFHDVFLLTTLFLALREGKPGAHIWLPIFFVTFYLSCALRHVLHDSLGETRFEKAPGTRPGRYPLNLQNARVLAVAMAVVSAIVFASAYGVLHGALQLPAFSMRRSVDLYRLEPTVGDTPESPQLRPTGLESDGEVEGLFETERPRRTIGFRYSVSLRDLTLARYDRREVLRARGEQDEWRPAPGLLWKAVSFSKYDSKTEEWVEEARFKERPWPADGRLHLETPPPTDMSAAVRLIHRVINPVCRNFVSPYHAVSVEAKGLSKYRRDVSGDFFPVPGLEKDSEYTSVLLAPDDFPGSGPALAQVRPEYVEVPLAQETGIDLKALAANIFPAGSPADAKIATLREYFRDNLRYSNYAHWQGGEHPVRKFLLEAKIGDCTYHATAAALLLRATGVPARLAVGFVGSLWDGRKKEAVVRNSEAHAWVEYHTTGVGWRPIDPTAWVPIDPSYRPPPVTRTARHLLRQQLEEDALDVGDESFEPEEQPYLPAGTREGSARWQPREELPLSAPRDAPRWRTEENYAMGINWLGVTEIPIVEEYIEEDLQSLTATEFSGHNFQFPEFAQPITGEESSENLTEGPRKSVASWQTFRPLLRTTIAVLGLVVVVILVVSFLKPGRSPDEDDEDDEALEDDDTADASWDVIDPLGHLNPRDPRDRIFIEYARLQQLLERTRNHRLVHQTPLEHAHQVGRENPELRKEFTQLNRTLYRTLYGRRPVSTEESRAAVENCRRIRNALR